MSQQDSIKELFSLAEKQPNEMHIYEAGDINSVGFVVEPGKLPIQDIKEFTSNFAAYNFAVVAHLKDPNSVVRATYYLLDLCIVVNAQPNPEEYHFTLTNRTIGDIEYFMVGYATPAVIDGEDKLVFVGLSIPATSLSSTHNATLFFGLPDEKPSDPE